MSKRRRRSRSLEPKEVVEKVSAHSGSNVGADSGFQSLSGKEIKNFSLRKIVSTIIFLPAKATYRSYSCIIIPVQPLPKIADVV